MASELGAFGKASTSKMVTSDTDAKSTATSTSTAIAAALATEKQKPTGKTLSNDHVRDLIEQGHVIVILGRNVLKLDSWVDRHPGGRKIIHHVIGREASSEIRGFHSPETRKMVTRFSIGILADRWKNMVPPLHRDAYHGPDIPQPMVPVVVEDEVDAMVGEEGDKSILPGDNDAAAGSKNVASLEEDSCASTGLDSGLLVAPAIKRCNSSTSSTSTPESSRPPSVFSAAAAASDSDSVAPTHDDDGPSILQLDAQTQDEIMVKFAALSDAIEAEGLYAASAVAYAIDFTRCAALLGLMLFFLQREWYMTSACFMGFFWHQIVATAHDAGHLAVTQRWHLDTAIGTVVMNFAGGLSCGWWKRNHNIHHLVPNSLSHDADVQLLPFIALSPRMFDGLYSTVAEAVMAYSPLSSFFVTKQAWLYYILLSLGRFNLYFLAFDYVLNELFGRDSHKLTPMHRKHRMFEVVGLVFFWTWYGYFLVYLSVPGAGTKFLFILVSHVVTLPLHLQLTVSHFSMSTDEGPASESWIERTLRTTMDIDAARWLDWFHGGLQFQVTHHLFPRIPRHSLRRASELTQAFCDDIGIKYEKYDFPECNRRLLGRLDEVAALARLLVDCKDEVVRKGEYLHGHWE